MKKIVLILLLFATFTTISAQQYVPFPTDSAQWSVRHTITSPFSQNTVQYKMKGDTVLNGITYHKIYYSLDLAYSSPNQALHCFVREDTTKKVFVKYPVNMGVDTSEFMLYNFNVAIGDTMNIRLFYPIDLVFKIQVYNIDSFQTNVDFRKYYLLLAEGQPVWPCLDPNWIGGVGSNFGPFYNEVPQNECGYEISCFWHKGIYIMGGTQCDVSTGIEEKQDSDNQSHIFPNPAQSQITLEFDLTETSNSAIEIKNILGQTVKIIKNSAFSKEKNKIEIDVSEFSRGLYFLQLKSDNKIMCTKFAKE